MSNKSFIKITCLVPIFKNFTAISQCLLRYNDPGAFGLSIISLFRYCLCRVTGVGAFLWADCRSGTLIYYIIVLTPITKIIQCNNIWLQLWLQRKVRKEIDSNVRWHLYLLYFEFWQGHSTDASTQTPY